MGLDHYIFKKKIDANEDEINVDEKYTELIYWRKVYFIHDWFCNRFDVESCKDIEITKDDLKDLLVDCRAALKNPEKYLDDEDMIWEIDYSYAMSNIKRTVNELPKIIDSKLNPDECLIYHAWW